MVDTAVDLGPAEQVSEVRHALLRVAKTDPERWWTAEELREAVQNGHPATIVSIALNDLIAGDKLRLNNTLHIQYAE